MPGSPPGTPPGAPAAASTAAPAPAAAPSGGADVQAREQTVGAATALLDDYQPGDTFFASPSRTLLARGAGLRVPHGRAPLSDRVADTLGTAREQGLAAPFVVGAVPFASNEPVALTVPGTARWAPPLRQDPLIALPAKTPSGGPWQMRPVPGPEAYAESVGEAVRRLERGDLDKVVLARTLELRSSADLDTPAMVQRLARRDPRGYTFAMPTGPGRTLLGASPELLLSRRGRHIVANPLAGSARRSADVAEDVRAAAALLESAKDLHEHAVVVQAVRDALGPLCSDLFVPPQPTLVRTATMWHLSTTVSGELAPAAARRPQPTSLDLALALHPTPAVCGTPTGPARGLIGELEPFDRGFFTGMVGWSDERGDGEWVVTIRCAEAEGRSLRLYAGAGVVQASVPASETEETAAKFRTFLDAVGAEL
ncbi:isochorismate synthase [Streptomyces sp. Amel2xB2]|uniref:isochorismate synthase n=1 Tax=Streptomyces sp. Amel2xB2 TaxID=1305829 RepID=UPI000DB9A820